MTGSQKPVHLKSTCPHLIRSVHRRPVPRKILFVFLPHQLSLFSNSTYLFLSPKFPRQHGRSTGDVSIRHWLGASMMTSAQLHGSFVLSNRSFVQSTGHLQFSPLRVSLVRNRTLLSSNILDSKFTKRNNLRISAFDANTVIQYGEDKNDSKLKEGSNIDQIDLSPELEQIGEKLGLNDEIESAPKKHAIIHDFCLGIPFGLFVFTTGIISFLLWKNSESLLFGVAPGFAIFGLGVISLNVWKNRVSSLPFILAQAAVAAGLLWKYIQKVSLTKKIFPWGLYGFVSAAMICFYAYVLLSGGNPPPKKKAPAPVPN